jgi:hypothetical protein
MKIAHLLLAVAFGCVAWNIVAGILICRELGKRGVKVNYLFIKALILSYVGQYRRVTSQETGRPGSLFYQWIVFINAALVTALAAVVTWPS